MRSVKSLSQDALKMLLKHNKMFCFWGRAPDPAGELPLTPVPLAYSLMPLALGPQPFSDFFLQGNHIPGVCVRVCVSNLYYFWCLTYACQYPT